MNFTISPSDGCALSSSPVSFDALLPRSIPATYPIYYSHSPTLLPGLTDKNLSLLLPIITYWIYALSFVFLDSRTWPILDKYRVHTPAELQARNHVPPTRVASFVLAQQALGVLLTVVTVKESSADVWPVDHREGMRALVEPTILTLRVLLGKKISASLLASHGPSIIAFTYWWAKPAFQFVAAFFIMETWQYWLHRLFHTYHFLYRHLHSWHHQIYVPYAFAALYAHPLEALLLNIVGAALGFSLPGLTTRMGIVLFVGSTCKAVDDHSGYRWPRFGPNDIFCLNLFQCIFGENSEFHDLHHHVEGQKHNFSQPFSTFWDKLCGTYSEQFAHSPHGLGLYPPQDHDDQKQLKQE